MATGRPTKYESKLCDDLIAFFDVEPYQRMEDQNGKIYLTPERFPTLAGWCAKHRIHRSTLHEWVQVHAEFSDAYKIAKELQEDILIRGGISGAYSTAFSVFTAKNAIGWRDQPVVSAEGGNKKAKYTVTLSVDDGSQGDDSQEDDGSQAQ